MTPDYAYGRAQEPHIAVHQFGGTNGVSLNYLILWSVRRRGTRVRVHRGGRKPETDWSSSAFQNMVPIRWGLTLPPLHPEAEGTQRILIARGGSFAVISRRWVMWQETPAARIVNRGSLENCAVQAAPVSPGFPLFPLSHPRFPGFPPAWNRAHYGTELTGGCSGGIPLFRRSALWNCVAFSVVRSHLRRGKPLTTYMSTSARVAGPTESLGRSRSILKARRLEFLHAFRLTRANITTASMKRQN